MCVCACMVVCVVTHKPDLFFYSIPGNEGDSQAKFLSKTKSKMSHFYGFKPLSSICSKLLEALFFKATERLGLIVSNA